MQSGRVRLVLLGMALIAILFPMPGLLLADTLSLQESVSLGVSVNPTVLSAKGELKVTRGAVWKSLSPPSPVVRIQNEWIPQGAGISNYGEQSSGISQMLDLPLVTYFGVKSAHYTKQSAYSAYQVAIAQATAEITIAYLEVWLVQRR